MSSPPWPIGLFTLKTANLFNMIPFFLKTLLIPLEMPKTSSWNKLK